MSSRSRGAGVQSLVRSRATSGSAYRGIAGCLWFASGRTSRSTTPRILCFGAKLQFNVAKRKLCGSKRDSILRAEMKQAAAKSATVLHKENDFRDFGV